MFRRDPHATPSLALARLARRCCISAIVSSSGTGWPMLANATRPRSRGLEAFGFGPEISEISRRRAVSQSDVPRYPRLDENSGTAHRQESRERP